MTGKTHIVGGIAASLGVLMALDRLCGIDVDVAGGVVAVSSASLAAIFPDIDEPNSTISHKLPFLSGIYSIFRFAKRSTAVDKNSRRDAAHRGNTHHLFTWLIVSIIAFGVSVFLYTGGVSHANVFFVGISTGYLSHILLDLISGRIQVLAPFSRKNIGIRLFTTGGIFDILFVRVGLILLSGFIALKLFLE